MIAKLNLVRRLPNRAVGRQTIGLVAAPLLSLAACGLGLANDFRLGPLVRVSFDPSPFADCDPGSFPGPTPDYQSDDEEKETFVAVNPTNPKNIVAIWIAGKQKGNVAGVSFDGGRRWQNVVIPGLTKCSGGVFEAAADPWVSFAPNGDLYQVSAAWDRTITHFGILVSKSLDGGLHWTVPLILAETTDRSINIDKPAINADPTDARFVYAVWEFTVNGNKSSAMFSRTTDAGRTWEPARAIYQPATGDNATGGHQIRVLPNGVLVDLFLDYKLSNAGTRKDGTLSIIRSTDRGQTWSAPSRGPSLPTFFVIDPDTGNLVLNAAYPYPALFSVASDPSSGNLCCVWEDTRFSGGLHSSVAFSMSADAGLTWSAPVPVNKTPTNITPGNQQAFMPTVAVAADGTVAVTYYDFRFNDANPGLLTDVWLVHCHPTTPVACTDPANWGNELRLTTDSFDLEKSSVGYLGAYWIGDYQGLATVGDDFIAVWTQPIGTDPDNIFSRRAGP
jgi:hypothetical protein